MGSLQPGKQAALLAAIEAHIVALQQLQNCLNHPRLSRSVSVRIWSFLGLPWPFRDESLARSRRLEEASDELVASNTEVDQWYWSLLEPLSMLGYLYQSFGNWFG